MRVEVEFDFCAAHKLPIAHTVCNRFHGHNYVLTVVLDGPVDVESGMVMDFDAIDALVSESVVRRVDHQDLNTILRVPTAENLLTWIWRLLAEQLPSLAELRLQETRRYAAVYRGEPSLNSIEFAEGYEGPGR